MGNLISSLGGESASSSGSKLEQAEKLRRNAGQLAEKQRQVSGQSQIAYKSGNGKLAKDLSLQARALHQQVEAHNREAARLFFEANNEGKDEGTIDLHGLFVKEALQKLDVAASQAKKDKRRELVVIVGAGNHSEGGVQRIRPAVEKWCRDRGHAFKEVNQGCLRVYLKEQRKLCIIM